jgi:hypothetical protein
MGTMLWLVIALVSSQPTFASTNVVVLPLHITRAGTTTTATCTLIHREDRNGEIRLYFVTAGHLFRSGDGERLAQETSITVGFAPDTLAVDRTDVVLPAAAVVDMALLPVNVAQTDLVPGPIGFEPPAPGAEFLLSGFAAGRPTDVPQRARFVSTVFLVGDRDVSGLDGCLGSAASAASSAFGVVAACEPGKTPIVILFRPARAFLERNIPGLRQPSLTEARGEHTPAGAAAP